MEPLNYPLYQGSGSDGLNILMFLGSAHPLLPSPCQEECPVPMTPTDLEDSPLGRVNCTSTSASQPNSPPIIKKERPLHIQGATMLNILG